MRCQDFCTPALWLRRLVWCRRVGRARPRTAQNPAQRLGDDEDDMDMEDNGAADVAGPSGLHSEHTDAPSVCWTYPWSGMVCVHSPMRGVQAVRGGSLAELVNAI